MGQQLGLAFVKISNLVCALLNPRSNNCSFRFLNKMFYEIFISHKLDQPGGVSPGIAKVRSIIILFKFKTESEKLAWDFVQKRYTVNSKVLARQGLAMWVLFFSEDILKLLSR